MAVEERDRGKGLEAEVRGSGEAGAIGLWANKAVGFYWKSHEKSLEGEGRRPAWPMSVFTRISLAAV